MDSWKRKLIAWLHDPPHKQFDIANHEKARGPVLRHLGLTEEEMAAWSKNPDWFASAADRYPFPLAQALAVDWKRDGDLQFHHPLAGTRFTPSEQPREKSSVGEMWLEKSLNGLAFEGADERAKLFRLWRFWAERAAREQNDLMAYLPADSRIPDHTIWQHNALCSALEGAGKHPAFLLIQIGPVQEYIAQSRRMQDLWSGSYLFSYLISKALAAIALEIGPDAIIYPNLRGMPLMDWWWKEAGLFPEETFERGRGRLHPDELLVPSLPNRLLALVPGDQGRGIAALAESAIRDEWERIAASVHADICTKLGDKLKGGGFAGWDSVWMAQIGRFPVIDCVLHQWTDDAAPNAAAGTPPLSGGWENHPLHHAELWRQIVGESKHAKANAGSLWALHCMTADWKFAAAKSARGFREWSGPGGAAKDFLNGRDEVLGGEDNDAFWGALRGAYDGEQRGDFKGRQRYGALTVIKRLWPRTYLRDKLGWEQFRPHFDSVEEIAKAIDSDDDTDKYYAVLCMDGDDMGQWVGGDKAPPLTCAMADKAARYFEENWPGPPAAKDVRRSLTPSYHAALSEALNNFSLYAAGPVVKKFGGQLFYAGGDDVLAILPVQKALDCTIALECAFQGCVPDEAPQAVKDALGELFEFPVKAGGFLRCLEHAGSSDNRRPNWPLLVPGPRATASAGIAVGHVRSPMQDVIQSAREAGAAAKRVPGKGAFSLRITKRSGESAEFAASFASGVAAVWDELKAGVHDLSGRFAYRYAQLLKPLLARVGADSDDGWEREWTDDLIAACATELRHVLRQQGGQKSAAAEENARRWIERLIGSTGSPVLTPKGFLHFWMAWAFMKRNDNGKN